MLHAAFTPCFFFQGQRAYSQYSELYERWIVTMYPPGLEKEGSGQGWNPFMRGRTLGRTDDA